MKLKFIILLALFMQITFAQQGAMQNRFMLAQSYEQIGEFAKAKSIYEDLYKAQPANFVFFQSLNKCYLQLKEYNNSRFLIEQKLSSDKENISLIGMLGITHYLNGDEAKAFTLWDNFLEKKNDVISFRVLANSAIELRAFDKAIELLQRAKNISEKDFYLGYDLANLYALKMDYKKSAEELVSILKTDEKQLPTVEARTFTYTTRNEALHSFITVFEIDQPENFPAIGNLLAKLYTANHQYQNAFSLYKILDVKQAYLGSELFNFAIKLSSEKEFGAASEVFSYIVNKYPNSPMLAQIKLYLAKNSEAKLAVETADSAQLWKTYPGKQYSQEKPYEEILAIYKEIAEKNPFSDLGAEALYRIGYLYGEKIGNSKLSEEYLNKIIANFFLSNFYADACMELATLKLKEGNKDGAALLFEKILANPKADEEHKNIAKFWKARIAFFQSDFTQSNNLLRQLVSTSKDNTTNDALELSFLVTSAFNDSSTLVKFAEGDFALLVTDIGKAIETFSSLSKSEQTPFLIKQLAELRLIESYISLNDYQAALLQINALFSNDEKNIFADKAKLLAAKIYQYGLHNPDKAIEEYQNLLLEFPESLFLDEAREAINKLRNKIS